MNMRFSVKNLLLTFVSAATATLEIIPGASWTASNTGLSIQAHGGQIINSGGTYYLIGEDKSNGNEFTAVNCYSSSNLVEWTFVRALLSRTSSGDLGPNRVVERPKVIYNSGTKQWVMYMHIDSADYSEAKVGLATSSSLCGAAYSYKASWQPNGHQSRDMGLFKDDDGKGYLISEDRENGIRIIGLTSDYTNVTSTVHLFPGGTSHEAPAMIKRNGVYFLFVSAQSGYDPNDNSYATASSLSGTWSSFQNFAPAGTNTYSSQTTYILPVGNNIMYMGDRWISSNLVGSSYVWLPISISGTTASIPTNYVNWNPSTFGAAPSEYSYEGEAATLTSGARQVTCNGCSGGAAAGYIGGSSNGQASFSVRSDATTKSSVRIKYTNGDNSFRYAKATVNGAAQNLAFIPTGGGTSVLSATLNCNLNQGQNQIVVSGLNGNYGPDIDRMFVPKT